MNDASAAAFTVAAMYAVIDDDEPSYTSGAHIWNGTAAILKPKPITSIANPVIKMGLDVSPSLVTCVATDWTFVVPVAPYTSAIPYSRNAVANAPSRKYLSAPSAPRALRRLMPASA